MELARRSLAPLLTEFEIFEKECAEVDRFKLTSDCNPSFLVDHCSRNLNLTIWKAAGGKYCPPDKFIGSRSQLLNNSEPYVASIKILSKSQSVRKKKVTINEHNAPRSIPVMDEQGLSTTTPNILEIQRKRWEWPWTSLRYMFWRRLHGQLLIRGLLPGGMILRMVWMTVDCCPLSRLGCETENSLLLK